MSSENPDPLIVDQTRFYKAMTIASDRIARVNYRTAVPDIWRDGSSLKASISVDLRNNRGGPYQYDATNLSHRRRPEGPKVDDAPL